MCARPRRISCDDCFRAPRSQLCVRWDAREARALGRCCTGQDTPRVRCTRVNYAGRRVPLLRVAVCACRAAPVWASWGARGFESLLCSGAWWRVRGGRNAKPHAVPPEGGGGHGGVWGSRDRRCHVRGTSPVGHASVTRIGNGSPVLAPRPRADPLSSPPLSLLESLRTRRTSWVSGGAMRGSTWGRECCAGRRQAHMWTFGSNAMRYRRERWEIQDFANATLCQPHLERRPSAFRQEALGDRGSRWRIGLGRICEERGVPRCARRGVVS